MFCCGVYSYLSKQSLGQVLGAQPGEFSYAMSTVNLALRVAALAIAALGAEDADDATNGNGPGPFDLAAFLAALNQNDPPDPNSYYDPFDYLGIDFDSVTENTYSYYVHDAGIPCRCVSESDPFSGAGAGSSGERVDTFGCNWHVDQERYYCYVREWCEGRIPSTIIPGALYIFDCDPDQSSSSADPSQPPPSPLPAAEPSPSPDPFGDLVDDFFGDLDLDYLYTMTPPSSPPAPPLPPVPPAPPPLELLMAQNPGPFVIGPCSLTRGGLCASSPRFPADYSHGNECIIANVAAVPLTALAFNVEGPIADDDLFHWNHYGIEDQWGEPGAGCVYDYLTIDGVKFCSTTGPDGVVPIERVIRWRADSSIGGSPGNGAIGWEICWSSDVPPAPPPAPYPPLPSPPLMYPSPSLPPSAVTVARSTDELRAAVDAAVSIGENALIELDQPLFDLGGEQITCDAPITIEMRSASDAGAVTARREWKPSPPLLTRRSLRRRHHRRRARVAPLQHQERLLAGIAAPLPCKWQGGHNHTWFRLPLDGMDQPLLATCGQ